MNSQTPIEVSCFMKAYPSLDYKWEMDGRNIHEGQNLTINDELYVSHGAASFNRIPVFFNRAHLQLCIFRLLCPCHPLRCVGSCYNWSTFLQDGSTFPQVVLVECIAVNPVSGSSASKPYKITLTGRSND